MQSNVIPLEPHDDFEQQRALEFDALYARYLRAKARFQDPTGDEAKLNKASNECGRLVWEIIKKRAVRQYQIAHKLRVLRELLEGGDPSWVDCRERILLESIRMDVGEP